MNKEKVKNILYYAGLYFIAAVLFLSGTSKILDSMPLVETLKLAGNFPEELLIAIATALPVLEIGIGALIILKIKPKPVLFVTMILFAIFFLFSIYGTIAGLSNDCGCFGSLIKSEIGWGMAARNAFLFTVSFIMYLKIKPLIRVN